MAMATVQRLNTSRQEPNGPSGPPKGTDPFANGGAPYGMSPWYGNGHPMPWSGPPGQSVGQRAPAATPDAGDPRNAGYFVPENTPDQQAAIDTRNQAHNDSFSARLAGSPGYQQMLQKYQGGQLSQGDWVQARTRANLGLDPTQLYNPNQGWPTPTMADGTRGPGAPSTSGGPMQAPPQQGPPPTSYGAPAQNPGVYGNSQITGYQPSPGGMGGGGIQAGDYVAHPGGMQGAMSGMGQALNGQQGADLMNWMNSANQSPNQSRAGQQSQLHSLLQASQQPYGQMYGASSGQASAMPYGGGQSNYGSFDPQMLNGAMTQGRTAPWQPFNPPPGGRPFNPPPPAQPPVDPRQFPGGGGGPSFNPYITGNSGYTPFQGGQWGGQVGYDTGGGLGQYYGNGGGGQSYGGGYAPQGYGGGMQYGAPQFGGGYGGAQNQMMLNPYAQQGGYY